MSRSKIIAIIGPTASGKTKLAVQLAQKYNGEIVSADSRQVYKGMDIGTGKDLKEYEIYNKNLKIKMPYYLIDVASPKKRFNLAKYQKLAFLAIDNILRRNKLPIIVGGSGLYLQAVIDNFQLSKSKPDLNLRKKLEKKDHKELLMLIAKTNKKVAQKINFSDRKNKRRLIRYLEILQNNQKLNFLSNKTKYNALIIGIKKNKIEIEKRIFRRLIERLEKENMIKEVENLKKSGLSWKRLESFGLEYKFISFYLQHKITYEEMIKKLFIAIKQFSKRQMTWFKRWERQGREIFWINDKTKAEKLIDKFLS